MKSVGAIIVSLLQGIGGAIALTLALPVIILMPIVMAFGKMFGLVDRPRDPPRRDPPVG